MSHLFNIKSVVLIALIILLFGLMVGQMIHVLLVATRKENRNPRGAVAYEALLLAHLLLAAQRYALLTQTMARCCSA